MNQWADCKLLQRKQLFAAIQMQSRSNAAVLQTYGLLIRCIRWALRPRKLQQIWVHRKHSFDPVFCRQEKQFPVCCCDGVLLWCSVIWEHCVKLRKGFNRGDETSHWLSLNWNKTWLVQQSVPPHYFPLFGELPCMLVWWKTRLFSCYYNVIIRK